MPVHARRYIRKLRGGAQAHLLEADDGRYYVVKFRNNPQHRRILVNEWIAGTMLRYLGLSCPDIRVVQLDAAFIESNPEVYIQLGGSHVAVEIGWHFGSQYPGDPATVMVYDFVPDTLLEKVANLNEFAGVLAFDKWAGNADARQAIFLRARLREYVPSAAQHPLRMGFVGLMVDHGYIFNGPHWEFADAAVAGLYFRPVVYDSIRGYDDFQPWLDRVLSFPEEEADRAMREVPPEWLEGDEAALYPLMERLMNRRRRVADLLRDAARWRVNPFRNWNPD